MNACRFFLGRGANSLWFGDSLTFVATANTHELGFQLSNDVDSYLSIDGIALTAVPEPSTGLLTLAGLIAAGLLAQRSRS